MSDFEFSPILLAAEITNNIALISFCSYLLGVLCLGWLASRVERSSSFVSDYFLGGKTLGVWAFALTFAATSASGGSFMGFPSLIYTHGWVLALWIAGYMLVPVTGMALLGKRLNYIGRQSDAVTIPEVLSKRFDSTAIGVIASLITVVFIFLFLLAQFKAGATILNTLLQDVSFYQVAVNWTQNVKYVVPYLADAEPDYLLCLFVFSFSVITYVVYGGFRAVVWTDIMQGIVMFVGVVILLVLTLNQVGGLKHATTMLAKRTRPILADANLVIAPDNSKTEQPFILQKGTWLRIEGESDRICRLAKRAEFPSGDLVRVLILTNEDEIAMVEHELIATATAKIVTEEENRFNGKPGVYVYGPGPNIQKIDEKLNSKPDTGHGFLGLCSAFSFFIFWNFSGAGQPSNMVRLMAFKDTRTLQLSIVTVSIYYSIIYFSLVVIFTCSRILIPGMEIASDSIMPEMAVLTTANSGVPWLAGLLLAAPFAAVMSSVDSFLLLVASSLVRDVYERIINPSAGEKQLKFISYTSTLAIGIGAMIGSIYPLQYLQELIIDASTGLSSTFLIPVLFAVYWKRMNAAGAIFGMLGGFAMHFFMTKSEFGSGLVSSTGFEPFLWNVVGSVICLYVATMLTRPPKQELVDRYF